MASKDTFDLSGKKALITGSAEGIGLAIAKQFAQHGCQVVIHDKEDAVKCEQACLTLRQSHGIAPAYVLANFEDPYALETFTSSVTDLDILVLNASIQLRQEVLAISRADFDRHVNTNFWTTLYLIQHYLPEMVEKRWGRIITVGSVQQVKPHPQMAVYAALKAAVSNLIINIASQFGQQGVTANNVAPGVIETSRNTAALSHLAYADQLRKKIPLGYFGQADDCSGIALLLSSEAGQYITGQNIYCDGGMSIL